MKVLFLTGREHIYPRNTVLLNALRRLGTVDVIREVHSASLLLRSLRVGLATIPKLLTQHYDLVFVGFYGHLLMLPVGLLSKSVVLFDAFVSTYDTLCFDRQVFAPRSPMGYLAFQLDRVACTLADGILLDTEEHAKYFRQMFSLPSERVHSLYLGCDETLFYPRPTPLHNDFIVLFYGTYQPLHGVETIIRAAGRLIDQQGIRFRLVGDGLTLNRARDLTAQLHIRNVEFCSRVPLMQLPNEIALADVCLGGPFGKSEKAGRVVAGKTYQFLAMGKTTIVSDTPANRELLEDGGSVAMCPPDDPQALADTIRALHHDSARRQAVAVGGLETFRRRLTLDHLTHDLGKIIQSLPERRRGSTKRVGSS